MYTVAIASELQKPCLYFKNYSCKISFKLTSGLHLNDAPLLSNDMPIILVMLTSTELLECSTSFVFSLFFQALPAPFFTLTKRLNSIQSTVNEKESYFLDT